MENETRFKENLKIWSSLNSEAAKKLENFECQNVSLTQNEDGQINLKKQVGDTSYFLHSQQSPVREAQQWFLSLDLKDITILYVYGIGLGYYYDMIKDWLKEDAQRFVVFLEDDLEVVKHFLETERASEFLKNRQVKLFHFSWEASYFVFGLITSLFSLMPFKISALKFYQTSESGHIVELYARVAYFHDMRQGTSVEFLGLNRGGFIYNFYRNLLELPKSKLELKMRDHFKGIPAIICGAGPSLGKNIQVLKTLQDKALIMAGGTAMNVLNGAGITPHFGLGIDPNPSHYNRLISNTAFEVPFFYRQRMFSKALKVVHGERIFVTGAGGYRLPAWFEEKLELPSAPAIEEGHNVVNFNLSIAKELGCNPIIIVGVDLAYSDSLSYAPGLVRHAIHDPKEAFQTKSSHEELLVKNDIYGVPVNTLWKWVNESLWYAQFAQANPEMVILNCTEGGIGFSHVPNMKLAEAAEKYLTQSYDFSAMIHGEIQNSAVPENLNLSKVIENFDILVRSLLHSESYLGTIIFELGKHFQDLQNNPNSIQTNKTPSVQEYIEKLEGEEGFKFLLQDYKERFIEIFFPRLQFIESDPEQFSENEIVIKRVFFDISLYSFLAKVARHNINIITNLLQDVANETKKPVTSPPLKTVALKEKLQKELKAAKSEYSFENNRLRILDSEMDIHSEKEGKYEVQNYFYPNGLLKEQIHKLDGKLYGPTTFFAENGKVLAQNWYLEGLQEGKAWFYYNTGELYALKRYKHGQLQDRQEYYYLNGFPKSILHYKDGLIDGSLSLYYETGKLKREMHFDQGKKSGVEHMWNEDGLLMIEADYHNDIPKGTAREWFSNGNLAKEIKYFEDSDEFEIKLWHENGLPISPLESSGKDYFDVIANHSKSLSTALQNIYQTLVNIAPTLPESKVSQSSTSIENDLLALKQQMEKLTKYNHELMILGGFEGSNPKESLWKTPDVEKMMKNQMDEINKKLTAAASLTQANLKDLFEKISQMKMQEEQDEEPKN